MSRAPQQRRLDTRERLLQAARDVIADAGIENLRTDDVVDRAGVAKGTFFSHFPDKEHLLAVLVAERLAAVRVAANNVVVTDKAQVLALLLPVLAEMIAEPAVLTALVRFGGPSSTGLGVYEELCAQATQLTTMLATLQVHRAVRIDVDASLLAEGVQAFVFHAAATAACGPPGTDAQARGRALLQALVDGWLSIAA